MKNFCFTSFFRNGLAYIFLAAGIFIYAIILDWNKIANYVGHFRETNCEPVKQIKISFGIYDCGPYFPDPFKIVEGLFYFISFPSVIIRELLISDLKYHYPHFCPETFDVIGMIYFLIINSFYWMFLGYVIEAAHGYYSDRKSLSEKPLSLFGK